MGNSNSVELNHENMNKPVIKKQYKSKYNLIPSHPGHEYESITHNILKRKYDVNDDSIKDKYVDLRNNFPNIINISNIPLNPIACVSYILHYSLLKNNLPIFPPSLMYIYNNIQYYPNVTSIMCFDV